MKYENPELVITLFEMQDVITGSTQENWGTGGLDDEIDIEDLT